MSGSSKNTTIQGRPMILKMEEVSENRRQWKNNLPKHHPMQPKILVKTPTILGSRDVVPIYNNIPNLQISRKLDDIPTNPVNLVNTQEFQ